MASLLAKFRIDYSDLTVIPDVTKKPQEKTVAFFEQLIKDRRITDEDSPEASVLEEGHYHHHHHHHCDYHFGTLLEFV